MSQLLVDNSPASRQQVRDAVVLVLKYSPYARLLADKDFMALLDHQMAVIMPRPDTLVLKGILEVLKMRPGFDVATAIPPLARLKTWEPWLRMRVETPAEFIKHKVVNAAEAASPCRPTDAETEKVIPAIAAITRSTRARVIVDKPPVDERAEQGKLVRRQLRIIVAVGALVGVGGAAAFIAVSSKVTPVAVTSVSDTIALASAERSGKTVRAVLKNPVWMKLPQADREEALQASWAKVRVDHTVEVFELVDAGGVVLARLEKTGPTTPARLTWAP